MICWIFNITFAMKIKTMIKEQLLFENIIVSKPFLKWAGGKGQLLKDITSLLPNMETITTYIEPFVGSGALLFWILSNCTNLKKVIINDINKDLINTYKAIKYNVNELINELENLDSLYKTNADEEYRKSLYYTIRDEYNSRDFNDATISIRMAALFIFLNRTCFNGLYRVNSKNLFNVPCGKYANPKICDKENLLNANILLQNVELLCGDYSETIDNVNETTFIYFDPPYKPISQTSSFNSYSSENFDDAQQIRLKDFCDIITEKKAKFMLSNSDPNFANNKNTFFDDLYEKYNIIRVEAKRNINANGNGRGKINEILVTNY